MSIDLIASLGYLWTELFVRPVVNGLILLSSAFFNNFGLAIIGFTIVANLLLLPLRLKQTRSAQAMAQIQPKIQELQKRYGKDKERFQQEQMRLFREAGVSPLGCAVPTFIQMPIWYALYQAIFVVNPVTAQGFLVPDALLDLSKYLYNWLPVVHEALPVARTFLWLDLARPDPTFIVLPGLVALSMWVQQKMSTYASADPKQESMNKIMTSMMPVMFGFFTLQVQSGLALYWLTSGIIGVIIQYFVSGRRLPWGQKALSPVPASLAASGDGAKTPALQQDSPSSSAVKGRRTSNGSDRSKRKDSKRSRR